MQPQSQAEFFICVHLRLGAVKKTREKPQMNADKRRLDINDITDKS
jgi:hypothetical protein